MTHSRPTEERHEESTQHGLLRAWRPRDGAPRMTTVSWQRLGSPGEVMSARVSADASTVAVGTDGGVLYLRRRDAAGWRWERVGTTPNDQIVLDAAVLSLGPAGALTAAVIGDDLQVWLYESGATTKWTGLSGPAPDPEDTRFAEAGDLVASSTTRNGVVRHTLTVSSGSGRPWIREGVDPDGTWFRISAPEDWAAMQLATAMASATPEAPPQQHLFAIVMDRTTFASALRIAFRENQLWTWIDPGGPAPSGEEIVLSATTIRDAEGRLRACAVIGTSESSGVRMVTGAGRQWEWVDLGEPPVPDGIRAAVLAAKAPDPKAGEEPVVVARTGHEIWTGTRSGGWTNHGTTPGDVAVVSPTSSVELGEVGARKVWSAGVSWGSDLWTFEPDEVGGLAWEPHAAPGTVVSIVGGFPDTPDDGVTERPFMVFMIDEYGALWVNRVWGGPEQGFALGSGFWEHHGRPAPGVTCATGAGAHTQAGDTPLPTNSPLAPSWVAVIGSDGHLWVRTADPSGWSWVDHGAPAGRRVKTAVPPIAVSAPPGAPTVHALADDGRLWMRTVTTAGASWVDRAAPQGQLITVLLGAVILPTPAGRVPLAAAVTSNGHVWVNLPGAGGFPWTDLGMPMPNETISTGIGMEAAAGGSPSVNILALGLSGQVWRLHWGPGAAPQWTPLGRPEDARIRGRVGTMPDSATPGGQQVAVVGNDKQVWVRSMTAPAWSRWDPQFDTTVVVAAAVDLLAAVPCAVVLADDNRVHIVTPQVTP